MAFLEEKRYRNPWFSGWHKLIYILVSGAIAVSNSFSNLLDPMTPRISQPTATSSRGPLPYTGLNIYPLFISPRGGVIQLPNAAASSYLARNTPTARSSFYIQQRYEKYDVSQNRLATS